jgi:hypothetical protein
MVYAGNNTILVVSDNETGFSSVLVNTSEIPTSGNYTACPDMIMNPNLTLPSPPTTTTVVPSGGSGGGGGGASSGVAINNKMIYGFGSVINDTGFIFDNLDFVSFDDLADLHISYGTTVLAKSGQLFKTFTITNLNKPDTVQNGTTLIGAEYDFEPAGATFSPNATLTVEYPKVLPKNVTENMLTIAVWNDTTKTYDPLNSVLDGKKHEITAGISHFARYAIVAVAEPVTTTPDPVVTTTIPVPTTTAPVTVEPGPDIGYLLGWLETLGYTF